MNSYSYKATAHENNFQKQGEIQPEEPSIFFSLSPTWRHVTLIPVFIRVTSYYICNNWIICSFYILSLLKRYQQQHTRRIVHVTPLFLLHLFSL